eukprot:1785656-Amphidinium_carterae.1
MLDFSVQSDINKSKTARWEQAQIAANRAAAEYCEFIKAPDHASLAASKQKKVIEPQMQRGVHVERKPVAHQ